jgi:hypothetical protein
VSTPQVKAKAEVEEEGRLRLREIGAAVMQCCS